MKVIDLYVKMANKEEVPEKIKYEDKLYVFVEEYEKYYRFGHPFESFEDDWYLSKILNDEIEIIEDTPKKDKKIKELNLEFKDSFIKEHFKGGSTSYLSEYTALKLIYEKQCEIIDKLNGGD